MVTKGSVVVPTERKTIDNEKPYMWSYKYVKN